MCSLPICEHARFFVITLFTLWQWYDKNPWSITLVTDVRKTNGNLLNCLTSCNLWRMEEGGLHAYVYREWKMQIIPLVPDKLEGPTTCLAFLRILIDNTYMETPLPAEKLEELLAELQSWSFATLLTYALQQRFPIIISQRMWKLVSSHLEWPCDNTRHFLVHQTWNSWWMCVAPLAMVFTRPATGSLIPGLPS